MARLQRPSTLSVQTMSGETFSVDVSAMRKVWEVKDAILDQGRSSCEFRLYRAGHEEELSDYEDLDNSLCVAFLVNDNAVLLSVPNELEFCSECRFYENRYPEIGSLVMARTVTTYCYPGVYVALLEYGGIEGMVLHERVRRHRGQRSRLFRERERESCSRWGIMWLPRCYVLTRKRDTSIFRRLRAACLRKISSSARRGSTSLKWPTVCCVTSPAAATCR